jgi:LacI family transcriptional regulator
MVTIRDVAKHAGVSPITVSRVINDSDYVSDATRARVEAAIEELKYVPNMLGPSLRFKQTMTLALVLTDITNPFWTTVARGVEDVAQANGYSIILCNTDESQEKQEQYLNMLLRRRIDGIVLVPAQSAPEPVNMIQKHGVPVVVLDRQIPDLEVDIVRADSENGAYQLTNHLVSLGHRRITMLAGPETVSTAQDRVHGYKRALKSAGLPDEAASIYWGAFTIDSGREMAEKALTEKPDLTALFAANNFIAIGAMQVMREKGLAVPDAVALVTVDDIPPTFTINPFLTVARQPAQEMGQQAAQLLLDRVTNEDKDGCRHIILPTELIIRASSGSHRKL